MLRSRVFLGGQMVSMLGDGLAVLAIPLLVLQLTDSPVLAVLASVPRSLGYLAVGLPAGVLADRLDPWLVLAGADAFRAAAFLGLYEVTGLHRGPVWAVLALACAAGAMTVFFETSLTIMVRDVFTGPGLVTANSWLEAANQSGQVIGPGVAGLLAATGELRLALLIDALSFLASLGSLAILRSSYRVAGPPGRPAASWSELRREFMAGIRYLTATRLLFALLIFVLVLNLCLGADKLIIFLTQDTLRLPGWQAGLVIAAGGAGGVLGAAAMAWLGHRLEPVLAVLICAAVSGLALILISTATSMLIALAGNLLYSWAIIAASVMLRVLRQMLVRRDLLGRVTAAWRLGGQLVTSAGAILAGTAAGLLGGNPRPVFAAAGALTILTVLVAWAAGVRPGAAGRSRAPTLRRSGSAPAGSM